MKATIKYFLSNITAKNQKLAVKQILVDKPWALIDSEGEIQKLIFKDDNGLILSKNGKVVTGTWEYFPNSRALFIDRGTDKILLQDQYIDENILLLKRDGTDDEYFALANENTIPSYDVKGYLLKEYYNSQKVTTVLLNDNNTLLIHNYLNPAHHLGCSVEIIDKDGNHLDVRNGKYYTATLKTTVHVEDQIIKEIEHNSTINSINGKSFIIEGIYDISLAELVKKPVFYEGKPADSQTIQIKENQFIIIDNGILKKSYFLKSYTFTKIGKVTLQQNKEYYFSKGDQVVQSDISQVPDGKYRIKGTLQWIKFRNNQVV